MINGILHIISGSIILYLSIEDLVEKYSKYSLSGKCKLIAIPFIGLSYIIIGLIIYFQV